MRFFMVLTPSDIFGGLILLVFVGLGLLFGIDYLGHKIRRLFNRKK